MLCFLFQFFNNAYRVNDGEVKFEFYNRGRPLCRYYYKQLHIFPYIQTPIYVLSRNAIVFLFGFSQKTHWRRTKDVLSGKRRSIRGIEVALMVPRRSRKFSFKEQFIVQWLETILRLVGEWMPAASVVHISPETLSS